jgi:hypothetical protein
VQITRRTFLQYSSMGGLAFSIPGCREWPCDDCPPPTVTPPRGLKPPKITPVQLPPWPSDPEIEARKRQIRIAWSSRPRPLRQDGMWTYLLIRAFPGDKGARPAAVAWASQDIKIS